jgi:hypothetical protein
MLTETKGLCAFVVGYRGLWPWLDDGSVVEGEAGIVVCRSFLRVFEDSPVEDMEHESVSCTHTRHIIEAWVGGGCRKS